MYLIVDPNSLFITGNLLTHLYYQPSCLLVNKSVQCLYIIDSKMLILILLHKYTTNLKIRYLYAF